MPELEDFDFEELDESEAIKYDLGACCACGEKALTVRNIMMLPRKAPIPGTGWGCAQCDLPLDGAIAVVCDVCAEARAEIKQVCYDYVATKSRLFPTKARCDISQLSDEPFNHDLTKHPELNHANSTDSI